MGGAGGSGGSGGGGSSGGNGGNGGAGGGDIGCGDGGGGGEDGGNDGDWSDTIVCTGDTATMVPWRTGEVGKLAIVSNMLSLNPCS